MAKWPYFFPLTAPMYLRRQAKQTDLCLTSIDKAVNDLSKAIKQAKTNGRQYANTESFEGAQNIFSCSSGSDSVLSLQDRGST